MIKPGPSLLDEKLGPDYDLPKWFKREYEAILRAQRNKDKRERYAWKVLNDKYSEES